LPPRHPVAELRLLSSNVVRRERLDSADVVALAPGSPLPASDIQEAILEGRQPKGMQLVELMKVMPSEWGSSEVVSTRRVPNHRAPRRGDLNPSAL
jgi:hypothetical protein